MDTADNVGAEILDRMSRANSANGANSASQQEPQPANAGANSARTAGTNSARTAGTLDGEYDTVVPPPVSNDAMFYGLLGEFALLAASGTEVSPVAAMAAAMSWLSASVGRNVGIPVGNGWHHLRLFTLHVGRSSVGRKGEALGLLGRVRTAIKAAPGGGHTGAEGAQGWLVDE